MATSGHPQRDLFLGELQPRIGELLLSRGLITADQLAEALAGKQPGEKLGAALVRLRLVFEDDLVRTLASQCRVEYVDLATHGVDYRSARLLPQPVARELDAIPVRATAGGSVVVAVADPLEVDATLLERALGAPVEVKVAELSAIRRLIDAVWPRDGHAGEPAPAQQAERPPFTISVADRERAQELRDYFRRLGADAAVESDGVVVVAAGSLLYVSEAGERADVQTYLRAWTAMNGTAARLADETR